MSTRPLTFALTCFTALFAGWLGLARPLHVRAAALVLVLTVPFALFHFLRRPKSSSRRFSWAPPIALAAILSLAFGAGLYAQGLRAARTHVAQYFPVLEAARRAQGTYPQSLPHLSVMPPWFIRRAYWFGGASAPSLYYRTGCQATCFCIGFPEVNAALYHWVHRSRSGTWGPEFSTDHCGT